MKEKKDPAVLVAFLSLILLLFLRCNPRFPLAYKRESRTLINASEAKLSTCLFTKSSMGWLWHRRLGHVGMKQLNSCLSMTWLEASKMLCLRRISFVALVKPANKLETPILKKAL